MFSLPQDSCREGGGVNLSFPLGLNAVIPMHANSPVTCILRGVLWCEEAPPCEPANFRLICAFLQAIGRVSADRLSVTPDLFWHTRVSPG